MARKRKIKKLAERVVQLLKLVTRPPKIEKEKTSLARKILSEWRELLVIDFVIIAFTFSSMYRIAVFFAGDLRPDFSSWLEAFGVDVAIVVLARSVTRSVQLKEPAWPLWAGLLILTYLSVYANYSYMNFRETGCLTSACTVKDSALRFRALVVGGSLPLLILVMIIARVSAANSFYRRRERYQVDYMRKKKEQDEKLKFDEKLEAKRARAREYARAKRAAQKVLKIEKI